MVRADPFRDEVAIDFPSARHFIARVRESFLRDGSLERDDALHAEVLVSSEEAVRGAVLPLVVVLRGTCEECGGRGEIWTEPCHECFATGSRPVRCSVRIPVPPGVAHGARLRVWVRAPSTSLVRVEIRVAIRHLRV